MRVLGNEREIVKVSLLNGLPPRPKLQKVTYLKRVLSIHIYANIRKRNELCVIIISESGGY
jgi:hypothetical protein